MWNFYWKFLKFKNIKNLQCEIIKSHVKILNDNNNIVIGSGNGNGDSYIWLVVVVGGHCKWWFAATMSIFLVFSCGYDDWQWWWWWSRIVKILNDYDVARLWVVVMLVVDDNGDWCVKFNSYSTTGGMQQWCVMFVGNCKI